MNINKPGPALRGFPFVFVCKLNSHDTITSKLTVFLSHIKQQVNTFIVTSLYLLNGRNYLYFFYHAEKRDHQI